MNSFLSPARAASGGSPLRRCALFPLRRESMLLALVLLWVYPLNSYAGVLSLSSAQAIALADNPGIAEMQARYEASLEVAPQQAALPDA